MAKTTQKQHSTYNNFLTLLSYLGKGATMLLTMQATIYGARAQPNSHCINPMDLRPDDCYAGPGRYDNSTGKYSAAGYYYQLLDRNRIFPGYSPAKGNPCFKGPFTSAQDANEHNGKIQYILHYTYEEPVRHTDVKYYHNNPNKRNNKRINKAMNNHPASVVKHRICGG